MSMVDGNLSKLSALCTRLQKLCTAHPVLAPTAVDKLADLLLSLQDQTKKPPTKGRSASATRSSVNSHSTEPSSGRESKAGSVSFKDENHAKIRNVVSKPTDQKTLRNSAKAYEELKSSAEPNPDYETLQREYEAMTVKVHEPVDSNQVEVFDYDESSPSTPHIVTTSQTNPSGYNNSRQPEPATHFQNEREQQLKKKLELRKSLDDQVAEKKAKEISDALRDGTPLSKIRGYKTYLDSASSTSPPTPIETAEYSSRTESPSTPLSTSGGSTSSTSGATSPQYSRFKYNQATPEQQEALLQKFQKQQEFKRMLQEQMDEKEKIRVRALASSSNSMHSTW
eukprot:TRINITY_DN197_c1_g1_i4.p1 TRINITY_DN197_c1_g1~~TRINITY_DN197_c1_g1_i4.p1  ORF type:complete len:339 (-),score=84.74 TRINITY_DN197_c1_g1_i4:49-1065(-)